jgi:hypothetical protein
MRRIARYAYVSAAWLTLAWVLVTVFVAGMALFVNTRYWQVHREIGWGSELAVLLLILTGLLGWIPRRLTARLAGLILLLVLHISLPILKDSLPLAAALHPLTASLLVWLSLVHARTAQRLLLGRPAAEALPASEVS